MEKITGLNLEKFGGKILEGINQGIGIMSISEDKIIYTNQKFSSLFGYNPGELDNQPIEILIPEEDLEEDLKLMKEFIASGSNKFDITKTPRRIMKDGTIKPFHIHVNLIKVDDEDYIIAFVNEFSKSEISILEHSVQGFYLKEAEKMAHIGHFEMNISTNEIQISQELRNSMNLNIEDKEIYSPEEFLSIIHPEDRSWVFEQYQYCMEKGCQVDISFRVIDKDQKTKFIHNTALINNRNSKNEPTTVLGVIQDVTNQQEIEQNLRELNTQLESRVKERTIELEKSQKLYRLIAQNFPNGEINVFDKDLNYVFVEGMEMYKRGITGEMLIGTSFLKRIDEEIRDEIEEKLLSVFKGKNINFELQLKEKTFMIYSVGLKDSNNQINQIMMVSQNITNLKKAEREIIDLLEKEQKLNELKSRFVSMASHEFRTPLTTIMNSLSLLSRYIGDDVQIEKSRKHLDRIRSSVHNLTGILNDFLSLDKLAQGKIEVNHTNLDLTLLTQEVINDFELSLKEDQHIIYEHSGENELELDKQMLRNILNNLISNAIKYSTAGDQIELKTYLTEDELKIVIIDHGIGIPKEEQKQMFDRFFRAKNALNIQGTGLGLSIIKHYMDLVNGKIRFTSKPGVETKFTVQIPLN